MDALEKLGAFRRENCDDIFYIFSEDDFYVISKPALYVNFECAKEVSSSRLIALAEIIKGLGEKK